MKNMNDNVMRATVISVARLQHTGGMDEYGRIDEDVIPANIEMKLSDGTDRELFAEWFAVIEGGFGIHKINPGVESRYVSFYSYTDKFSNYEVGCTLEISFSDFLEKRIENISRLALSEINADHRRFCRRLSLTSKCVEL